jgi:hypothetical protein
MRAQVARTRHLQCRTISLSEVIFIPIQAHNVGRPGKPQPGLGLQKALSRYQTDGICRADRLSRAGRTKAAKATRSVERFGSRLVGEHAIRILRDCKRTSVVISLPP